MRHKVTATAIKVMTVVGTRPEAIKMAPVIRALQRTAGFESSLCVTAQHREMLDQMLGAFGLVPDIDLDLMKGRQTLANVTALVLTKMTAVLKRQRPDWVLVQGDTTTALAAALAAFYLGIPVGHVEAGLRTHDRFEPFPEEVNRRIADAVSTLHFAPTALAAKNLEREGIAKSSITITGNTGIDALLFVARSRRRSPVDSLLQSLRGRRVIVVTAHRRENFGAPLEQICLAIQRLARRFHDVHFVYPVHLNPNVRRVVFRRLGTTERVTLLDPLDYFDFVKLLNLCTLIITDSGGIQEEAPSLGKPVFVLRNKTERSEAVAAGVARLVGTDSGRIEQQVATVLEDSKAFRRMAKARNPFGDGHASLRIVRALARRSSGMTAARHLSC